MRSSEVALRTRVCARPLFFSFLFLFVCGGCTWRACTGQSQSSYSHHVSAHVLVSSFFFRPFILFLALVRTDPHSVCACLCFFVYACLCLPSSFSSCLLLAWRQYLASLYWTIATLMSVGYGDISANNNSERLFALGTMVSSGGEWAG